MCATRTKPHGSSHASLAALGVTCCVLLIAGCGSSARPSSSGASGTYAQGVKYSDCMRSHGVPNYPDPGGRVPRQTSEINQQSPAFEAAQKVCAHLHPGSSTPAPISAAQRAGMIAYARCIRTHGVPRLPDPRFGPGGEGVEVGVLGAEASSPAFKRAVKACEHVGTLLPGLGAG